MGLEPVCEKLHNSIGADVDHITNILKQDGAMQQRAWKESDLHL